MQGGVLQEMNIGKIAEDPIHIGERGGSYRGKGKVYRCLVERP